MTTPREWSVFIRRYGVHFQAPLTQSLRSDDYSLAGLYDRDCRRSALAIDRREFTNDGRWVSFGEQHFTANPHASAQDQNRIVTAVVLADAVALPEECLPSRAFVAEPLEVGHVSGAEQPDKPAVGFVCSHGRGGVRDDGVAGLLTLSTITHKMTYSSR